MISRNNRGNSKDSTANMIKILTKQRVGLKICHINAQSLAGKIDELRFIFENSGVDIVCVSETWFDISITDLLVSMDGFTLYRSDRADGYGGVAIYVRSSLSSKVKRKGAKHENDKVECLFIEVCSMGRKILIGSIYRPDRHISFDYFLKMLEEDLTPFYTDIVIAGDFNSDLLIKSDFADSMKSLSLYCVNTQMPTHFTKTNSSLLDLFFVSKEDSILIFDQLSAPCFSRHDLIFITYDVPLETPNRTIQYRDFKNINHGILDEEYQRICWNSIYYMTSVDDQLCFLEQNVLYLYNSVVPLKTKLLSHRQKPWFTSVIKRLIADRDDAYYRWKRHKTDALHNKYRFARRLVNKSIREAKLRYYTEKFSNSVDTKKTWKTIREIGIGKSKSMQNNSTSDPDQINDNFVNILMPQANHTYYENYTADSLPLNKFSFDCVNQIDVLKSCLCIKSSATGIDGIHPTFFKLLLPSILPFVTHIFNTILTTSIYPQRWKQAKVLPIPKSATEYRPIAILPFLSKSFEKLLHQQLSSYLNDYKLLTDRQSGFRAKHSCITALTDVTEDIRREIDVGRVVTLVLLDHSKAFDTVDHKILMQKLEKMMNFSSTSITLMSSYLQGRVQCVATTNSTSKFLSVKRGVPQGSILGPLLFSIYANDLPDQLKYCKVRMYADDVQLHISSGNGSIDDCILKLNEDLNSVSLWAAANGLSINPRKSKCIVIRKRLQKKILINPDIYINNQRIEIVNSARNLGVVINNTLTWSDHIVTACGKTFSMLRTLWPTQYCTPFKIRLLLAKTYLIPILTYACELFASCDDASKSRLNVTYNNIARYVYGIGRFDSISAFSSRIYGVPLDSLLKIRTLIYLHKIITSREPGYLYNRIRFSPLLRNNNLTPFRHHTLISEWQFYINAVRLWNRLPPIIKKISNAFQFKKRIFEFYA